MSELPTVLNQLFSYIDDNKRAYIDVLRTAVAIESVSLWPNNYGEVQRMVEWTADKLKALGADVELADIGEHEMMVDGKRIPFPNVILADLGKDPNKKTIVVYGHLDVQPASKEDGWNTEPFELTEKDGKLYGRGATDNKGPVVCWMNVIEAYQKLGIELPVNVKFIFEGMEESDRDELLVNLVEARKNDFLANTDFVCITDNYWLGKNRPCLGYGLRGIVCYNVEVECARQDLHSGVFGGSVYEAMSDLCWLLSTLVDKETNITIPGIERDIVPLLPIENEMYESIDYDVQDYKNVVGANRLPHNENKTRILMARWRYPALSIHGIEGAYYEPGFKTVIPGKVIGKFSIRLVPNQDIEHINECVTKYLNEKWAERGSPNILNVSLVSTVKPWTENPHHPHYEAAKTAIRHVYNVEPDMTREGCSVSIALSLQEATGKNVILIPLGACDDGAHSQNEKIDVYNYIEGTKLLGAYMYEVGKL
ncbi:cytosolic non-specific dipeptidase-like [Musca vetustissima]|uniref:cytosolic non-specific dipeptidase-like n=1 Tax=Musca vetustissima TaxID=27455 RepID=UPI002AB76007|nr:cytosolic non-specific dipeptidase-like [Musca vetustissima]